MRVWRQITSVIVSNTILCLIKLFERHFLSRTLPVVVRLILAIARVNQSHELLSVDLIGRLIHLWVITLAWTGAIKDLLHALRKFSHVAYFVESRVTLVCNELPLLV